MYLTTLSSYEYYLNHTNSVSKNLKRGNWRDVLIIVKTKYVNFEWLVLTSMMIMSLFDQDGNEVAHWYYSLSALGVSYNYFMEANCKKYTM